VPRSRATRSCLAASKRSEDGPTAGSPPTGKNAFLWTLANGLAGPVLGVGCYQWALATAPGGVVLPIAATAPLLAIPIAFLIEGDRPTTRSVLGGVIAVAGCVALTLAR
jgi:drug/metabolite transporter (DMT)-like permease